MRGKLNSSKIGSVNGNTVFARTMSNFEARFHVHKNTEEMFIVQSGALYVDLETSSIKLSAGDSYTVPIGVKHRARAIDQTKVIVISKGLNA